MSTDGILFPFRSTSLIDHGDEGKTRARRTHRNHHKSLPLSLKNIKADAPPDKPSFEGKSFLIDEILSGGKNSSVDKETSSFDDGTFATPIERSGFWRRPDPHGSHADLMYNPDQQEREVSKKEKKKETTEKGASGGSGIASHKKHSPDSILQEHRSDSSSAQKKYPTIASNTGIQVTFGETFIRDDACQNNTAKTNPVVEFAKRRASLRRPSEDQSVSTQSQKSTGNPNTEPWHPAATQKKRIVVVVILLVVLVVVALLGGFLFFRSRDTVPNASQISVDSGSSREPSVSDYIRNITEFPNEAALKWLQEEDTILNATELQWRQRYALATLGLQVSGAPECAPLGQWLSSVSECDWEGITCATNDVVTEITLENEQLGGISIPSDISLLTDLEVLHISNSSVSGSIPPEIGRLTNLENLELGQNSLTGTIPSSISNLTSLVYLATNNNRLTGAMPLCDIPFPQYQIMIAADCDTVTCLCCTFC